MRVTGVLCFVTLMTPPAYYLKYIALDRSAESSIAANPSAAPINPPTEFLYIALELDRAERAADPATRIAAIDWLSAIVRSRNAQITHPFECLDAKAALAQIGETDPNSSVKAAANDALVAVAAHGAVIKR